MFKIGDIVLFKNKWLPHYEEYFDVSDNLLIVISLGHPLHIQTLDGQRLMGKFGEIGVYPQELRHASIAEIAKCRVKNV